MERKAQMTYRYDGSFEGFLCCVFESYVHKEEPALFASPGEEQAALFPEREIETVPERAERVYRSLEARISAFAQRLVERGFLTCAPDREQMLFDFIRFGYDAGASVTRRLQDPRVDALVKAVRHLENEAELLRGFVRFSDVGGVLASEIEPKNRVLSVLRPHFCARYAGEQLFLYDRTHREALFYRPREWIIAPLDAFEMAPADQNERDYRRLWTRFYDTIAIQGRENPRCRMGHMPKRYWGMMTEFQAENGGRDALSCQNMPAAVPARAAPAAIPAPGTHPAPGRRALG